MVNERIIRVEGLSVSFGETEVLSDINFSVHKGDVTVILGSSGCGKSTVLRHILGLHPITMGNISLLGQDISSLTEQEQQDLYLKLGVFYQNGALLNSMTVGENVALPLLQHTNLSQGIIDDMVYMTLGLVNLAEAFHKFPSELSGGMLKRAAIARAIILNPQILFCDEPGAGLDPVSLKSLDNLIINLKELLGMSIVLVTHEVLSILRIADRIIYLDRGKVAFEGTLSEALKCEVECVADFFAAARSSV